MCGIVGAKYFNFRLFDKQLCLKMNNSIKHRGPDDEGYLFIDSNKKTFYIRSGQDTINILKDKYRDIDDEENINADIFLAHRRLSIIDLSELGHQPMSNEDSNIWVTFNGEIYNYLEIKKELIEKGHIFRSNTDTEVIIHSYEEWGEKCFNKFNGMWSFALYDFNKDVIILSRDRFGVKPLYYYKDENKILFASEIKAILQDETYQRKENEDTVNAYLKNFDIEMDNNTFFEGIFQIEPGFYGIIKNNDISLHKYYEIEVKENKNIKYDINKIKLELFDYFYESIKLRLRADVEVGSLLSGGLDSTSIVSMINYIYERNDIKNKINTYSSISSDKKYDEQEYIDVVNIDKNCIPHKVEISPENLILDIEKLIFTQEEPFCSLSMYAQYSVMKNVSRTGIKVLLDGQGADEILAGYIYFYIPYLAQLLREKKFGKYNHEKRIYFKRYKAISTRTYYINIAYRTLPAKYTKRNKRFDDELNDYLYKSLTFSLRQLLRYEDKNSMAFSIESRIPFLDYKLVEYVLNLPSEFKINNGVTKYILRESLKNILPKKIYERKDKMCFVTPQEVWQKKELYNWYEEILNSSKYKSRKYYRKLDLDKDDYLLIWRYFNLEMWMRKFIDN